MSPLLLYCCCSGPMEKFLFLRGLSLLLTWQSGCCSPEKQLSSPIAYAFCVGALLIPTLLLGLLVSCLQLHWISTTLLPQTKRLGRQLDSCFVLLLGDNQGLLLVLHSGINPECSGAQDTGCWGSNLGAPCASLGLYPLYYVSIPCDVSFLLKIIQVLFSQEKMVAV